MKNKNGNSMIKDLFGTGGGVAGLTKGKKITKKSELGNCKTNSISKGGLTNLTRKAFPNMKG